MKIKTFEKENSTELPKVLSNTFNLDDYCVVDIETTGLSRQYSHVILIGILFNINNKIIVKQLFAENTKEEVLILKEFANIFKDFKCVITYNGASFDIPFLKERFKVHNLNWIFYDIKHIDILQCLRKEKQSLGLDNLRLKTVEKLVGINRKDTISGKDSVLLYKEYVKNKSSALENTILLHNYEDIYYLNKLLSIFERININLADLFGNDIELSYNHNKINFNYLNKDVSVKKNTLMIAGKTDEFKNILDFIHYGPGFNFSWYPSKGIFALEIPLSEGILPSKELVRYVTLDNFNLSKDDFHKEISYIKDLCINDLMILVTNKIIQEELLYQFISLLIKTIFSPS